MRARPSQRAIADAVQADPRWGLLVARDKAADGAFVYSVRSTGVFCRPSCASRSPRPENVAFHADAAAAVRAGFRACLRCTPDRPAGAEDGHPARVAAACRAIDAADAMPSLAVLAADAGLSPHHFHRVFKAATGVTPRAYAVGVRARRVRDRLAGAGDGSVTDAIHAAGFHAAAPFYAQADALLGMSPGRYRAGGNGLRIAHAVVPCALGQVLVAASAQGICAIALGDDAQRLREALLARFDRAEHVEGDAAFDALVRQVVALVDTPARSVALPLDIQGTAFQQRVWQALRAIPAGSTATYTQVAQAIGAPTAARAVAAACAANTLAVAIPCHRVVRGDGSLSGYRWGVARKRALLDAEADG